MIDLSTSLKQEKQERQDQEQIHNEARQSCGRVSLRRELSQEASLNTDIYSDGYFSGYIGLEPTHPENYSYWSGYQIGSREYWAKKLGVEIPQQF